MHKLKPFLTNKTRNTTLAQTGQVLTSTWRQAFGAMFKGLPGSYVFAFKKEQRVAITNLFVFEALDIVWLDTHWRVVSITTNFKPFRLHTVNKTPAQYVLELPAGTVARSRTKIGDEIRLETAQAPRR